MVTKQGAKYKQPLGCRAQMMPEIGACLNTLKVYSFLFYCLVTQKSNIIDEWIDYTNTLYSDWLLCDIYLLGMRVSVSTRLDLSYPRDPLWCQNHRVEWLMDLHKASSPDLDIFSHQSTYMKLSLTFKDTKGEKKVQSINGQRWIWIRVQMHG